jgi:soluble lytic murein transglycosylase
MAFLLFSFSTVSQASKKSRSHKKIVRSIQRASVRITKSDKRTARNILSIYSLAEKNQIQNSYILKTKKAIRKNKTFTVYKFWLTDLYKINNTKTAKKIVKLCSKLLKRKLHKDSIANNLKRQINSICLERSLSYIKRNIIKKKKLFNAFSIFIDRNLERLVYGKLNKNFVSFFKYISDNKSVYRFLSEKVINYVLIQSKVPSNELISSLHINDDLTLFVQNYGYDNYSTQNIFYRELMKLIANTERELEKDNNLAFLKTHTEQIINFAHLNSDYMKMSKVNNKLITFSKYLTRREKYQYSRKVLSFVISKKDIHYKEALFQSFWTFIKDEDNDGAIKFIADHKLESQKLDSKFKFWIATTLFNSGKKLKSIIAFKKIIKNEPLSFYSIMAHKKMIKFSGKEESKNSFDYINNFDTLTNDYILSKLNKTSKNTIKRLVIWSDLGRYKFAALEISRLQALPIQSLFSVRKPEDTKLYRTAVIEFAANILKRKRDHLNSFRIIFSSFNRNLISLNQNILKILFPKPYFKTLSKINSSLKNTIDPFIILSLIRQESGFNPNANSSAGAMGLMQLMPKTADFITRTKKKHLYKVRSNLIAGTTYFEYLYKKFDKNLVYTLSAYNAGEYRLKRWKKKFFKHESMLKTIESIPFNETKQYVQLIFRNIFFYKLLNMNSDHKKKDEHYKLTQLFDVPLGFNQ